MDGSAVKWRRRKAARPKEIVDAALGIFLEKGFAAAKMSEVAARAGVAKGSLYLYFPSKEALFRTVVAELTNADVDGISSLLGGDSPIPVGIRQVITAAATLLTTEPVPAVIRLVVSESRAIPEIAQIWHDAVAAPVIAAAAALIARGQDRGEIVPGDPRVHAISLLGPLVMLTIFREVFGHVEERLPTIWDVAAAHGSNMLRGIMVPASADLASIETESGCIAASSQG